MSALENPVQDAPKKKKKRQPTGKMLDPLVHPCIKEHHMALRCLDDNGYDGDKCILYFENYKSCMRFWKKVEWDRAGNGIFPHLPYPEDRPAIKELYSKKWAKE